MTFAGDAIVDRFRGLLPETHADSFRHLVAAMGLPVQLTNLREDLTGLLGLQSDAAGFKRQGTLRPWFETAKHIDDSWPALVPRLGAPLATARHGGRAGNRYEGHLSDYPIAACIAQSYDHATVRASRFLKVALLIGAAEAGPTDALKREAEYLRRAARLGSLGYTILADLSVVDKTKPGSTMQADWSELAHAYLEKLTHSLDDRSRELAKVFAALLARADELPVLPAPQKPLPNGWRRQRVLHVEPEIDPAIEPRQPSRPLPLQLRLPVPPEATELPGIEDAEPYEVVFDVAPGCAADDEPAASVVDRLEQRYTNYRTSAQNQRLPWSWTQLNPYELAHLRAALNEDLSSTRPSRRRAALLTGLVLATGKTVTDVVNLRWGEAGDPDRVTPDGNWLRRLRVPAEAFQPNESQAAYLLLHMDAVPLLLPAGIIASLATFDAVLGETTRGETLGARLGVTASTADATVRDYLSALRRAGLPQGKPRLLAGRVQRALANALMQATGDETLVHLLVASEKEMPPVGVFYHHYSALRLKGAYQQAVKKLFGDG